MAERQSQTYDYSEALWRKTIFFMGAMAGLSATMIGMSVGRNLFSGTVDITIRPSSKTLKTLFKHNASIVDPVDNAVCKSLEEKWEEYAKYHGLVNDHGEPIVKVNCQAEESTLALSLSPEG